MAHEIEQFDNVAIVGDMGWHGLGRVIAAGKSAIQAGEDLKMFEPITGLPLVAQSPAATAALATLKTHLFDPRSNFADEHGCAAAAFREYLEAMLPVESHRANVQNVVDSDGQSALNLLGIVGADYAICQNRELAEFTDALAQTGKVQIETCGTIRNGKRVWFLAKGDSFTIGGTDEIVPYVLVSNAHDGTQAIRVTPTTVRVVCSNTLHMVVPNGEDFTTRPESAAVTIRHCGKIADKLEQAKRALAYYGTTLQRNRDLFEAMQAQKFTREQSMQLFADTYAAFWNAATPEELAADSTNESRKVAENRMKRMRRASEAFLSRYESENASLGLGETAWSMFNAMTGYLQHDKTARGKDDAARVERRIESNLFGLNAGRTRDVLATALALSA